VLVPPEQGSNPAYLGDPYLIAKHLAGNAACFISHASAMEIHRMVTQPHICHIRLQHETPPHANAGWH
jgi:hypothetical protein